MNNSISNHSSSTSFSTSSDPGFTSPDKLNEASRKRADRGTQEGGESRLLKRRNQALVDEGLARVNLWARQVFEQSFSIKPPNHARPQQSLSVREYIDDREEWNTVIYVLKRVIKAIKFSNGVPQSQDLAQANAYTENEESV